MSLPRLHSNPNNPYASTFQRRDSAGGPGGGAGVRMPRMLKRLFKFPQMDFEVAIWEMTQLLLAPRRVVKQLVYNKQTRNTYTTADPAFPYLLSFFLFLTSLAWSLSAATLTFPSILRVAIFFVFVHCLAGCLFMATLFFFAIPRLLGPGGVLAGIGLGRNRRRGLFGVTGGTTVDGEGKEELEFGFCFDITIRAFTPLFTHLYILQFLLLPILNSHRAVPVLLSNTLYLLAFTHSLYILFLGFSSLPFLSSTHLILTPVVGLIVFWIVASAIGWSATGHLAPILWCGGGLRDSGLAGGAGMAHAPIAAEPPPPVPVAF